MWGKKENKKKKNNAAWVPPPVSVWPRMVRLITYSCTDHTLQRVPCTTPKRFCASMRRRQTPTHWMGLRKKSTVRLGYRSPFSEQRRTLHTCRSQYSTSTALGHEDSKFYEEDRHNSHPHESSPLKDSNNMSVTLMRVESSMITSIGCCCST